MKIEQSYSTENTIFAIFDNELLKTELENWSKTNNIKIFWGEANAPDIIAVPCFALIVDRSIISKEAYSSYLEFINEAKETNLFVAFDENIEMELPKNEIVLRINPTNKNATKWIIDNLDNAKKLK